MRISRRNFLGTLAGSVANLLSFRSTALNTPGPRGPEVDCAVLDLRSHCVLRESLQGYEAALSDGHNHLSYATPNAPRRCRIAIVPGVGRMDPSIAQTLLELLKAGAHLLLESGAGFLRPTEFVAHQQMLHRYFDLAVEPPVDLWSGNSTDDFPVGHRPRRLPGKEPGGHESISYVNYVWPCETKVRDFSRVIPVSAKVGEAIGRVGTLPVALKRRMDKGILIFLGSPLGPALRAGDPEARSWLRLVTALTGTGEARAFDAVNKSGLDK
jgi:hypothetical protein